MKISHSALEDYAKCGELFRLKRILKDDPRIAEIKKIPDTSLVLGTIVHDALEKFYAHGTSVMQTLDAFWAAELAASKQGALQSKLDGVAADIAGLFEKASGRYKGPGAIRTSGGSVSQKPQATTAWKQAAKALDLENRSSYIDQLIAANLSADSNWRFLSFSQIYAESKYMLHDWKNPSLIKSAISVELPFNFTVPMHVHEKINISGKIDLVCKTLDGKIMIVDHKTSHGDPPPDWKVALNDQLLLYGWMYLLLTGEPVDFIAIHHVRSKRLIPAKFDFELAEQVIQRHESALRGILADSFVKQNPVNYNNACLIGDRPCAFLAYCHPQFFQQVTN